MKNNLVKASGADFSIPVYPPRGPLSELAEILARGAFRLILSDSKYRNKLLKELDNLGHKSNELDDQLTARRRRDA
jgi:hypothetical protein